MNKNNYINLITICTCLIPTSLIVGAAVSEFFVSLTAIIFLVYTLNYKDEYERGVETESLPLIAPFREL